jgi:hypothetical protein
LPGVVVLAGTFVLFTAVTGGLVLTADVAGVFFTALAGDLAVLDAELDEAGDEPFLPVDGDDKVPVATGGLPPGVGPPLPEEAVLPALVPVVVELLEALFWEPVAVLWVCVLLAPALLLVALEAGPVGD